MGRSQQLPLSGNAYLPLRPFPSDRFWSVQGRQVEGVEVARNSIGAGRSVTSKVVAILDTFGKGHAHSLTDIANLTGLPISTVHRLATELASLGVLARTERGWYRIGPRFNVMGQEVVPARTWHDPARRVMEDLSVATGTNVRLGILRNLNVAVMEKVAGHHAIAGFASAAPLPAHATALGKALLAFSPPETADLVIARGLRPYTPSTLTDPDRLLRSLAQTRLTGIALSRAEWRPGVFDIAAPVFEAGGRVVAALEITVHDLSDDYERLRPALVVAARSLSRELQTPAIRMGENGDDAETP
jgi:DNA-binding IclR family transcriptional regulator